MRISQLLFVLFILTSCSTEKQIRKITAKTINIDSTIKPSSNIDSVIAPYKRKLSLAMGEVLSYTPKNLIKKDGTMQSSLGNLMADMCYTMASPNFKNKYQKEIDFVLLNYGGIRATLPKGNITTESAFKLMPFENELVVVELSGTKVVELAEYMIANKTAHPVCKNVEFTISKNNYELIIKGKKLDPLQTYNVLTNDYLLGGGDRMDFFKNPLNSYPLDYKMRDAIIDYFKNTDTIKASIDHRITVIR